MQVDELNISRNSGNNLSDSVNHFWAIAHGIKKKNSKNYESIGSSWKHTEAMGGWLEPLCKYLYLYLSIPHQKIWIQKHHRWPYLHITCVSSHLCPRRCSRQTYNALVILSGASSRFITFTVFPLFPWAIAPKGCSISLKLFPKFLRYYIHLLAQKKSTNWH